MKANPLDYSRFRVVVVSGPQRSGTTIAARMITAESGMQYVDEEEYGKDVDGWKELVKNGQGVVIHSPAMARWVHEVDAEDLAVVWMMRPLPDILASQKRIGWDEGDERPVAFVKKWYWYTHQRPFITNAFELEYEHLKHHPLWVEDYKRILFGKRQWKEHESA